MGGWSFHIVHPDPALLLAYRLQKDPIQHATSHGPTDWDNRFQILRGQRRVGLQPREHLRPGQRLGGSSGRRGELHGARERRGGRAGARSAGRGGGRSSGGAGAAHLRPRRPPPRAGRRSPPAARGRDAGRGWVRAQVRSLPGGHARPLARPSEPPSSAPAGVSRGRTRLAQEGRGAGRAGLGGVAARGRPSDRLPPPPPPPRGLRAPAPSA